MGFVDSQLLNGELSAPSPDLAETANDLLRTLEGSETIHIRGRAGTDLTLRIGGRPWKTDAAGPQPGDGANYPGGEVFVAPHSDGADGVLVADLTVPYTVDGLVDATGHAPVRAGPRHLDRGRRGREPASRDRRDRRRRRRRDRRAGDRAEPRASSRAVT